MWGARSWCDPWSIRPSLAGVPDPGAVLGLLGLEEGARLVVVSGGGWGVGDLAGAADAALRAPDAAVVVLSGSDAQARELLERRFASNPRVRVLGFTALMPELLGAADVLVHATGGMTSLEAGVRGCPLIAFGARAGHIGDHNAELQRLGLARAVHTLDELAATLSVPSLRTTGWPSCVGLPSAGEAIVAMAAQGTSTSCRTTAERERLAALAPSTISAPMTTVVRTGDPVQGSLATSGATSTGTTT